ncbi:TetR family transcriptional regulator [Actinomadura rubrobrunea]|uniref:TetR family transcriptional regulator n=1 Tax=Actinomadura rubrobrunea TaxID=115335 RepID=A0A9W6Q128_9ACTN|nr:TetR/AcrR family transcriptional regulator [Actinomadura rubrobrunea]GLW66628.1 TetR family transcriptional regulator [Actinomadura rubrobrunea]
MGRGRPRAFDVEERLDRAMEVFWRHGYEGAALSDLTAAMGINRPSLYAAYGNKEQLFRKALERYLNGPGGYLERALEAPTARQVAEEVLRGAIRATTAEGRPRGCLVVQGALATGEDAAPVREEVLAHRRAAHAALRERLERAQAEGDLPPHVDPGDLARYLWTTADGLSVQAAGGATREELDRVADLALAGWPS